MPPTRDPDSRVQELRVHLKEWEYAFTADNGGRKASKEDMKRNGIWDAYREYGKLTGKRHTAAASTHPSMPPQAGLADSSSTRSSRCPASVETATPSKRRRLSPSVSPSPSPRETPAARKGLPHLPPVPFSSPQRPASPHFEAPLDRTPAHKRPFIGPTPQKDGRVLGLFDLLEQDDADTPSRRRPLTETAGNVGVMATPSKATLSTDMETPTTGRRAHRLSRTPQSQGRRFLLDKYISPSKRPALSAPDEEPPHPSLRTPAFLRRSTLHLARLPSIAEKPSESTAAADAADSPSGRKRKRSLFDAIPGGPRKPRTLGRSLSAMIRDIRAREDQRLDDEMDAMAEMEAELMADAPAADAAPEDAAAPPQRVWKKKGAKRQTRRVVLKPVMHLRPPARVEETQGPEVPSDVEEANAADAADDETDYGSDGDLDGLDDSGDELADARPAKKARKTTKEADATATGKDKGGLVKKAARKVNELAHANFQRLKIRQKGGANKGRGRYGRR